MTGSRASTEPVSRLGPSGFDPERVKRFAEGDPLFPEMLERGTEFLARLSVWYGGEFLKLKRLGQQDRLGIARAMFAASAMSASGQDRGTGLEAKPASAVGEAETPKASPPSPEEGTK